MGVSHRRLDRRFFLLGAAGSALCARVGRAQSPAKLEKHKLVNLWVSMDRAQAVARELVRLGVPATAIVTEAKSDSDPLYFEAMPAGEAQNRRAEVYLE